MDKPRRFDPSVYFIADPDVCAGRPVAEIVERAAAAGVTMVQLRNKSGKKDEFLAQARAIAAILKPLDIPFIVNDNIEIALEAGADGVHLGQDDFPPGWARRMLGPDKIIGVTAFEPGHFKKIKLRVVDYAGTGPVYTTYTKPDKKILGVEGLKALIPYSPVPVVAIGGITPEKTPEVIRTGAEGVAMMRAISEAEDPAAAVRAFIHAYSYVRLRKAS